MYLSCSPSSDWDGLCTVAFLDIHTKHHSWVPVVSTVVQNGIFASPCVHLATWTPGVRSAVHKRIDHSPPPPCILNEVFFLLSCSDADSSNSWRAFSFHTPHFSSYLVYDLSHHIANCKLSLTSFFPQSGRPVSATSISSDNDGYLKNAVPQGADPRREQNGSSQKLPESFLL